LEEIEIFRISMEVAGMTHWIPEHTADMQKLLSYLIAFHLNDDD
jgi:hypothetical protein